ncbi:MAG: extracellular solute-binding protein, partial [Dorea sp.]|nr:extracellular solute-binding protein [Dorea sp.]
MTKTVSAVLTAVLLTTMLTGCRFGFASDPDDPNEEEKEVPIDTSVDTFEYDSSLSGTNITLLNSKAEIQAALEKMGAEYEKKSGVHVEVMPVTDGDSPYTKVVSLYNSGTPPTVSILDTTDVIALAEEKAADLTEEPWVEEAEGYITEVNGKVYSFPLCIEGRGIIYNRAVIEETLGESFDADSVTTQEEFEKLLDRLVDAGMEKPVSMAKEDWSLGAHQLQYIYETYEGTSEGAQEVIEKIKAGKLDLATYDRLSEFLDMFDILKKYNVAKGDPLGADYDEMAIDLADGKTAFWFNGNWAWPNISEAGAEEEDAYGFLPYFLNNDEDDFVNQQIQASPSKQVMLDGQIATEKEQKA